MDAIIAVKKKRGGGNNAASGGKKKLFPVPGGEGKGAPLAATGGVFHPLITKREGRSVRAGTEKGGNGKGKDAARANLFTGKEERVETTTEEEEKE